jgi:hypothetical protein
MSALTADWNCRGFFKEKLCDGRSVGVEDYALEFENFITTRFNSNGCFVDYLTDIDQDWTYFIAEQGEEGEEEVGCKKEKNQKITFNSRTSFQEDYCIWDYRSNSTLTVTTDLQNMNGTLETQTLADDLPDGTQCEDTPAEGAHCTSTYEVQCIRLSEEEKADLINETWKRHCSEYPEGSYPIPDECLNLQNADEDSGPQPEPDANPPSDPPATHWTLPEDFHYAPPFHFPENLDDKIFNFRDQWLDNFLRNRRGQ